MAVKRYNPTTGNWEIFPGTAGEDAYMMAQTNGYTGTKDEYIESLVNIPIVVNKLSNIDNTATKGSSNLINSNAVWKVEDDLRKLIPSNVALPERVYEVYQNGQVVGSGKLITEWNSPIATIDPYSINTLTDTWILSLQQILQWKIPDNTAVFYDIMPIDDLAAPYVYKIEWIGSLILVKQTRFTSIVEAVPEDIALSITNSDGSSAWGYIVNASTETTASISEGTSSIKAVPGNTLYAYNLNNINAGEYKIAVQDYSNKSASWILEGSICTKPAEPPVGTEDPEEPTEVDYRILGDIVFEDQQPYSTAPVTITYDDQLLEEVTNDNGEFVATVLSVDAPKNIAISAKGITLYNSSPSFDTERQANVGTLIVPGNSGEYTLYGTILYANGMTYSGAITYADGEGFRQESQVVNGILEIPLSKLVYNLTFTLMIGQQELTYDRVVSYSGYTATFEQIIIEDTVMPTSEPTESTSAPS